MHQPAKRRRITLAVRRAFSIIVPRLAVLLAYLKKPEGDHVAARAGYGAPSLNGVVNVPDIAE